jgi:hypothetical protein
LLKQSPRPLPGRQCGYRYFREVLEKKLIGWSLGLGIGLLIVLIALNHFVPIKI